MEYLLLTIVEILSLFQLHFFNKLIERIFTPLPAGVATPPTAAAIGIPNITLLPNTDFPGAQLFLFNITFAMAPTIIPAGGISAKKKEIKEVHAIKLSKTYLLLLPKIVVTYKDTLYPKPTFTNACAINNAERIKK